MSGELLIRIFCLIVVAPIKGYLPTLSLCNTLDVSFFNTSDTPALLVSFISSRIEDMPTVSLTQCVIL